MLYDYFHLEIETRCYLLLLSTIKYFYVIFIILSQ